MNLLNKIFTNFFTWCKIIIFYILIIFWPVMTLFLIFTGSAFSGLVFFFVFWFFMIFISGLFDLL